MFSRSPPPVVRPKVTPDPQHAAELARRFAKLEYRPEGGFLFEQRQERKCHAGW